MEDPFIWVRATHFAATILVSGIPCFAVFIAEPAFRKGEKSAEPVTIAEASVRIRLKWLAWLGLTVALISGAVWLLFVAARMADLPLADAFTGAVAGTVVAQTSFGRAWIVRLLLAALIAVSLCFKGSIQIAGPLWRKALIVSLAGALVGTLAWSGHAAAGTGPQGSVQLASDILHLLAAAAWLGGLLPLAIMLRATVRGANPHLSVIAREAVARFSILGIASVGTLLVTGLINSWMLVGNIASLTGTDYGRVLCVKIALFLGMVAVASINRLVLTPRLMRRQGEAPHVAAQQIGRNSLIEAAVGSAILLAVGLLGTLPPGIDS